MQANTVDSLPEPPEIRLGAFPFSPIALTLGGITTKSKLVSIKNKRRFVWLAD